MQSGSAGTALKGLMQMWGDAIKDPTWWIGVATMYAASARTLPKQQAVKTPYPANPSVPGTKVNRVLQPGETFDRYGPLKGNWGSQIGTDYNARSIPTGLEPYNKFEVLKPITVEQSLASPGNLSGQTGYGVQYRFPQTIQELLDQKIIGFKK